MTPLTIAQQRSLVSQTLNHIANGDMDTGLQAIVAACDKRLVMLGANRLITPPTQRPVAYAVGMLVRSRADYKVQRLRSVHGCIIKVNDATVVVLPKSGDGGDVDPALVAARNRTRFGLKPHELRWGIKFRKEDVVLDVSRTRSSFSSFPT